MAAPLKMEEEDQIREYVRFELVDFHCKALSKVVPGRHKKSAVFMYSGALSMGANHEVLVVPQEIASNGCPNSELIPDWSTEQVLPWACQTEKNVVVKRVYCEQADRPQAPRTVCRKLLKELYLWNNRGLQILAGGELEFGLAKSGKIENTWVPLFDGPEIFTTLQCCKIMDFCLDLEDYMHRVGVDIRTINTEAGAGQVEITFAPKFGIEAADMTATFRTGTKEIAQCRGIRATFMAKPFGLNGNGNGGHFNFLFGHAIQRKRMKRMM
jgi:glutamine synthetase